MLKKGIINIIKYSLITLAWLLFSALLLVSVLLFSHSGSQAFLKTVQHFEPRLSVELADGTLLHSPQFVNISWLAENAEVNIKSVFYQFDWSCLMNSFCLTSLNIDGVKIKLVPSIDNETQPEKIQTPPLVIDIPIDVIIYSTNITDVHFSMGDLTIDLDKISLQANAFANNVTLSTVLSGLFINLPDSVPDAITKSNHSNNKKIRQYLNFESLPALITAEMLPRVSLPINLNIKKFQLEQAKVEQNNKSLLALNNLTIALIFNETLLSIREFDLDLPETSLHLNADINFIDDYPLAIKIEGKLKNISQLQPETLFNGVHYSLTTMGSLSDLSSELILSNQVNLQLHSHFDLLAENLPHNIDLKWQKLQWPLTGKAQYSAKKGSLTSKGSLLDHQINLQSDYAIKDFPSGFISLKTKGDLQQVQVQSLKIETLSGIVDFSGLLNWQDKVEWLGQLKITDINLAKLNTPYRGQLSGLIKQQATLTLYQNTAPDWQFNFPELAIIGDFLSRPLSIDGRVYGDNLQGITFDRFTIKNAENNLVVDGRLAAQNNLTIDIKLDDISKSFVEAEGQVVGNIKIIGPNDALQIDTQLSAQALTYQAYKIENIDLESKLILTKKPQLTLKLNAQKITVENQFIDDVALNISNKSVTNNNFRHQIELALNSDLVSSDLLLFVTQTKNEILSQVNLAKVLIGNQILNLETPFEITFKAPQVNISAHCWQTTADEINHAGKLCIKRFNVGESGDVLIDIDQYTLTNLNLFLPDQLQLSGELSANATLQWIKDTKPDFKINILSNNMLFKINNSVETENFIDYPIKKFIINIEGSKQKIDFDGNIFADNLIDVQVKGQLLPYINQPTVNAKITSTFPDLSLFLSLTPSLDELTGLLHGELSIAGSVSEPDITGVIIIQDSALVSPLLPMKIKKLGAVITIKNRSANIQASFDSSDTNTSTEKIASVPLLTNTINLLDRSLKKIANTIVNAPEKKLITKQKELKQPGIATIEGKIDWSKNLKGDIHFFAHKLEVYDYGKIDLLISPDIHMLVENNLQIKGDLFIDYGRIVVKELPEGAVSQSEDIVVIDVKQENTDKDFPISLDLLLDSGNNFQIIALGLDTSIQGKLSIQKPLEQDLTINGVLELTEGSYRSLGQQLVLRESRIIFQGSAESPYLQIEAIRDTSKVEDDVIAGVRVTGTPDELELSIFSEPAMAQQEALSYLTRGYGLSNSSADTSTMANILIDLAAGQTGGVMSSIGEELGIKNLSLASTGTGDDQAVGISGEIAPGVELSYGVGVFDSFSIFSLRYELFEHFYIEASSGIDQAIDAFYQWDWD